MAKNSSGLSFNINLLAKTRTPLQQLVSWSRTYGLALTILIGIAVIALSSYRFSLQQQLSALNQEIDTQATQIKNQANLENEFLLTQKKLSLYQQIGRSEKIVDLFPKLNTLVPSGVQVRSLTIQPDKVELVCFVTDQTALALFVNNLNLANNNVFDDGQTLTIANTTAREIAQSNDSGNSNNGYDFSLSFNYTLN